VKGLHVRWNCHLRITFDVKAFMREGVYERAEANTISAKGYRSALFIQLQSFDI
jgi:hypothetical protein